MTKANNAPPALTAADEARFNMLMQQNYKKVYNMAYRGAGNRSDAEDLTQDAFYRAYRGFKSYKGSQPFLNWISRILGRVLIDFWRKRGRRVTTVSIDASLSNDGETLYFEAPDR